MHARIMRNYCAMDWQIYGRRTSWRGFVGAQYTNARMMKTAKHNTTIHTRNYIIPGSVCQYNWKNHKGNARALSRHIGEEKSCEASAYVGIMIALRREEVTEIGRCSCSKVASAALWFYNEHVCCASSQAQGPHGARDCHFHTWTASLLGDPVFRHGKHRRPCLWWVHLTGIVTNWRSGPMTTIKWQTVFFVGIVLVGRL